LCAHYHRNRFAMMIKPGISSSYFDPLAAKSITQGAMQHFIINQNYSSSSTDFMTTHLAIAYTVFLFLFSMIHSK
jgi:hypothetical protein